MTHAAHPALDAFGEIEIHFTELNDFENNCYLIVDTTTGKALLVDAADNAPAIFDLITGATERAAAAGRPPVSLTCIITTHQHPDHWQALATLREQFPAPTLAGADDAAGIPVATDRKLTNGDVVPFGNQHARVIGLRGHTPGSIALAVASGDAAARLITGDSLFPGGPGKTHSPAQFTQLMDDLTERVFNEFADETVVHPGHGKATTLGTERPHLGEWRQRGW